MLFILLISTCLQVCYGGRLQLILPGGHYLISPNASFNSESLLQFNKHVLGIENSANVEHETFGGNLFNRPKALIVISIDGANDFDYDGYDFNFDDTFESQGIFDSLKRHFGNEMMHAVVNSSGVFGSPHFKRNTVMSNDEYSDGVDIDNMEKLAQAIQENDRRVTNVVDYYRIHLDMSNARTEAERKKLEENIKRGIKNVQQAINSTENREVMIEVYSHGGSVDEKKALGRIRAKYNVVWPRYYDYPARFAILMLVSSFLLFAVVAMIWFMIEESDMGKKSLVYRLSTGRQKKD